MNDRPIEETVGRSALRVLALGDSHTYAVGVSQQEAWPNALEQMLFHGNLDAGTVYNSGVAGYSLGQYLVRYRTLRAALKPQVVVIGFSMATDLYDLVPPRLGGFVYGSEAGRLYFDLDDQGRLLEKRDLVGQRLDRVEVTGHAIDEPADPRGAGALCTLPRREKVRTGDVDCGPRLAAGRRIALARSRHGHAPDARPQRILPLAAGRSDCCEHCKRSARRRRARAARQHSVPSAGV